MLGPAEVRELAERLGVSPTKKLGQNFVIDPNTVRKIVRLAGVREGDRVIEVGPGLGSLTLGITEAGAEVTAVEIDHRLAAELPSTARAMQPDIFADPARPRLHVVRSDALEVTLADLLLRRPGRAAEMESIATSASRDEARDSHGSVALPEVLVANLPYNVSVPILMHLLELLPSLRRGLVMVQSEVGTRIAASPGSKEYGAPSAKAAWYGEWRIAGTVSRRIFWPVPGVDSVLVSYERRGQPRGDEAERHGTFALVNAAFAQRRKMLRQALQPVLGPLDRAIAVIEAAGLDPTSRAEQLGIDDYLALARSHARRS
ncbi:16S rRNA (adenine(1518)-N(6)/adenine(1519)-N(6))-dimethyltransferase RsmA [Leucobacter triazinivorans]|uniref:Ribosomal RNA small subunit methyltransferase A n=1 Tax=Leucobacter triazinivorans TaxID=1784719 RepID=A0A4P6KIZ9_9MICO|nr:16S rRNA (adenine(1518)-N(6)/adenine(1519)-N(6))-dimethyltransferase RsmA [Leucobacter triazinivorans]QBE50372.1 16S rRNA (adenine(1518)-N(6)/adenine(1519)-N(6))-dimethyltransferase RsmA [Leucobacter triazinivorans]